MSDSGITKGQYWNKRNCGHERVFFYQSSEFFFGINRSLKLWQPI